MADNEQPADRQPEADQSSAEGPGDLSKLREAAIEVLRLLVERGYAAFFAGGCVRDRLLGIDPTDYDVATSATPDEVKSIFKRAFLRGKAFGVMQVDRAGFRIEVATFRTDGVYSDGRHPDSVTFTDAEHDASRRDFTLNGLFEDPLAEKIIDHVGGRADIEARLVRAIGDPHARLREDRLRMLRGVRFAARFGFAIEAETADAIRAGAGELEGVSRERIGDELRRMLSDPNRAVAAWELQYLGLDSSVLGEPSRLVAPTRVGRLPDHASFSTALAAWFLDRHAGPEAGPFVIEGSADRWARNLMLSNDEQAAFKRALSVYAMLCEGWAQLGVAAQKRLASGYGFDDGMMLLQATDRQLFVDARRRVIELAQTGLAPEPLITGDDLIGLGMSPGPAFARVLDSVYDAQLEGAISEKSEALAMARIIERADGGRK